MSAPRGIFTSAAYEHDPRWQAVDEYTLFHLHPSSRPNSAALHQTLTHSDNQGLPDIATFPVFSKVLALQCRIAAVTLFLEIGTLGGYTPIWVATMNPSVRVISIEVNPEHARVARENIERAGVSDRVEIIVGEGVKVLEVLKGRVERGQMERVGMTYIDADKMNNWNYFDAAVGISKRGAPIYVDNVVRRGRLVDEAWREDAGVKGARTLVEMVGRDERVEAVVQQTVAEKNYDGYLMAVVK